MATEPSQSGVDLSPLPPPPDLSSSGTLPVRAPPGEYQEIEIWLDGEVVGCSCPECGGPMSIRMWLRLADCLRCPDVCIELTEEIIEDIERLKRQGREKEREKEKAKATPAPEPAQTEPESQAPVDVPAPPPPPAPPPLPAATPSKQPEPGAKRVAAASQPIGVRRKIRKMAHVGTARFVWQEAFRDLPAWIISALLHIAALLILAMLVLAGQEEDSPYITLSTEVGPQKIAGGRFTEFSTDEVDFDLPIDPNDLPDTREAQIALAQDARDLRLDADTVLPNADPIEAVRAALKSSDPNRRALAVRDPRVRAEMVRKEGGTTLTEAAVTRGLRWMAMHQSEDGSWRLNGFNRGGNCRGRCDGHGHVTSPTGGTALALLPYLGAGQTHFVGNYQKEVAAGLRYLISIQKENGDLRGNHQGHGMYAHGQAALVLCEAYKMSGDETLREPAQKAIDFISAAQYVGGGWRYYPPKEQKSTPDTSVLGWQVLALHSAKAAYLDVDKNDLKLAGIYLDRAQAEYKAGELVYGRHGGLYAYQPGQGYKETMTAEGLLCRIFMGWRRDHPGLREGVSFLLKNHLPSRDKPEMYYWYYATQMLHHIGGKSWEKWNVRMRDVLVQLQDKHGHKAGSWPPSSDGRWGHQGGRLYTTAFATAILEVYYRHAPLFRQVDLDD